MKSRCRRCSAEMDPKPPGPGRYTCDSCLADGLPSAHRNKPRSCFRCCKEKEPDAFPWGDEVRAGQRPYHVKRRKGKFRRRSSVCRECWAREDEEKEARRRERMATWEDDKGRLVRRCSKCRKAKLLKRNFYVAHRRKDGSPIFGSQCKRCSVERVGSYVQSQMEDPEKAKEIRAQRRRWQRRWREAHPEEYRATQRRYRQRLKADPERHAQRLENDRMAYRLRREREGHEVKGTPRATMSNGHRTKPPRLPAQPLAEWLERFVQREQAERLMSGHGVGKETILEPLGISSKALYRWQNETHSSVKFETADSILTATGIGWHDIWTPEAFPEVAAALAA